MAAPIIALQSPSEQFTPVLLLNRIDYTLTVVYVDLVHRGKVTYATSDNRYVNIADTFPMDARQQVIRLVTRLKELHEQSSGIWEELLKWQGAQPL